jgi:hypothetical protein
MERFGDFGWAGGLLFGYVFGCFDFILPMRILELARIGGLRF